MSASPSPTALTPALHSAGVTRGIQNDPGCLCYCGRHGMQRGENGCRHQRAVSPALKTESHTSCAATLCAILRSKNRWTLCDSWEVAHRCTPYPLASAYASNNAHIIDAGISQTSFSSLPCELTESANNAHRTARAARRHGPVRVYGESAADTGAADERAALPRPSLLA